MINTTIGKYKITRLIGEGGMASVYEAEHEMLGTKVAVKILNPILSANAQIKERFRNEAKLMASLDHPNITKVLDFDEQPQQLSILMEFLNGEDLNQKIKRNGPLSEKEIKDIFAQTLSAFQYAHEQGIVHRDIKPSNIFILPNGHVKILDFGIAKLFGQVNEMTQTGTQIGTPVYMSPEQVKADKSIDHRSDIYSLGVTLFFLINGKSPYNLNTESNFEIFNKIVFEPLPKISEENIFSEIISRACQKEREERFQSCLEFIQSLQSADVSIPRLEKNVAVENDKSLPTSKGDSLNNHQEKNKKENNIGNQKGSQSVNIPNQNKKLPYYVALSLSIVVLFFILYEYGKNSNMEDELFDETYLDENTSDDFKYNPDNLNLNGLPESFRITSADSLGGNVGTEEYNFNGLQYYKTRILINPNPKGGSQNVFFDKNYTLFDYTFENEPIFPVIKNGALVYQIYFSSNEDPTPHYGEFTPVELESHLYYKFKNKENCLIFCQGLSVIQF
jgi:serine/threonine protein kinase